MTVEYAMVFVLVAFGMALATIALGAPLLAHHNFARMILLLPLP